MRVSNIRIFQVVIFMFVSVLVFPVSSGKWLVSIDDKRVFGINNFNSEFRAFVDLQALSQAAIDPDSVKEARKNKFNRKMYLENAINDLLIMDYAKQKKLYTNEDIEKKLKAMNAVLRKQIIRKYFISKVIMPKVRVDEELVKGIYNKLRQSEDTEGLSSVQIRKLARRRAKMETLQRVFATSLDKLRSKHRIRLNDKYDNVFE